METKSSNAQVPKSSINGVNIDPMIVHKLRIVQGCQSGQIQQVGIDLRLYHPEGPLVLEPMTCKNIEIIETFDMQDTLGILHIRSSLSRKGIFLSSGVFDPGFKGRGGVTLYNMSSELVTLYHGVRFAQIVVHPASYSKLYKGHYNSSDSVESKYTGSEIKDELTYSVTGTLEVDDEIIHTVQLDPESVPEKKFNHSMVMQAIELLIKGIGDDPDRAGVIETPKRVADMYEQILNGYDEEADIKSLAKVFNEEQGAKGMVLVKDIPFYSFCEHHIVPFFGKLSIAYIPNGTYVLGLSKLVRIARVHAKKLQVQERLTEQIAQSIHELVPNQGVAVRIEAEHMCMSIRGVRTPGAKTVTTKLTGLFYDDPRTRNEFVEALK